MFKSRRTFSLRQRFWRAVWPHMGIKRLLLYYFHRFRRLPGSPDFIAAGFAVGTAVSFTPFIGVHLLLGAAVCWLVRASLLSMALATFVIGNPWTFPFIWYFSYKFGQVLLGLRPHVTSEVLARQKFSWDMLTHHTGTLLSEYVLPMFLGCLPMMVVGAALAFFVSRRAVIGYHARRAERLRLHAQERDGA